MKNLILITIAIVLGHSIMLGTNTSFCTISGGTLSPDNSFTFSIGDGNPDFIPAGSIVLNGNTGPNNGWMITDDEGNILSLPPNYESVDFNGAGSGTVLLFHISYDNTANGIGIGENTSSISGCFRLSNPIEINLIERQLIAEYDFLIDANDRISENNFIGFVGNGLSIEHEDCRRYLECDGDSFGTVGNPDFGLTNNFTISFWMRTPDGDPNQKIMGQVDLTSGEKKGWLIGIENNLLNVEVFKKPNSNLQLTSNTVINDNVWSHYAISFKEGGDLIIYKDGLERGKIDGATWTPPIDAENSFIIGAAPWDPQFFFFTGDLDDIRIFNNELTSIEVKALYSRCPSAGTPIYVANLSSEGLNTGTSWDDAFIELQSAIDLSCSCSNEDVWVAGGTYRPTNAVDIDRDNMLELREKTFSIDNHSVKLYGGFYRGAERIEQRGQYSQTILTGDLGNGSDTAYHVVHISKMTIDEGMVIDGFTIRDGRANGISGNQEGAGILLNALSIDKPIIRNNRFINNHASVSGGAISGSAQGASLSLSNCMFLSNFAGASGGAIYNSGQSVNSEILSCSFHNNRASNGGAYHGSNAFPSDISLSIDNSIFWGNVATDQGNELWLDGGDNATVHHSIFSLDGIFTNGSSNIDTSVMFLHDDPLFDQDLQLQSNSPAIDIGDSTYVFEWRDGRTNFRNLGGGIDLGAYESGTNCLNRLSFFQPVTMDGITYDYWTDEDIFTNAEIINNSNISFSHFKGTTFTEEFKIEKGSQMEVFLYGCD